eukprot:660806-Pelagomonas_calceolata.AAC.1
MASRRCSVALLLHCLPLRDFVRATLCLVDRLCDTKWCFCAVLEQPRRFHGVWCPEQNFSSIRWDISLSWLTCLEEHLTVRR